MATLNTFVTRSSDEIRDGMARTYRNAFLQRGWPDPNVTPGSDIYVLFQAIADNIVVNEANCAVQSDELMPDTSTGDSLARQCAIHGLSKQAAAGSIGPVILSSSASTTITTGDQLVDGAGLSYEVVTGGIYVNGAQIRVQAIDTGKDTNHAEGDVLRWVATPPFADEKALVGPGGLVNGIDEEDDEVLRGRLFARLQQAPKSGNAQHVAEIAESSSASVQKAFIYPAAQGPSTGHVAVAAAPTATNKSRVLASEKLTGEVIPFVQGLLPEHSYSVITTVTDVNTDVAFGLSLPEAKTASPPGPGGGWVNGTPWPAPDADTTWKCTVTGVTSTTVFTVDATTAPVAFVSKVMWLSPTEWKLYDATVVAVAGTSGAYTITLDSPFVGITTGCFIWPACDNAQAYVDAVLAAYALMGPGEKTTNAAALTFCFRRPRPAAGWPSTLGGHLTRAVTSAGTEVESAQFFYRTDGTTTLTDAGGKVTPQVPASLTDAPKIFIPRHIGFYRVP